MCDVSLALRSKVGLVNYLGSIMLSSVTRRSKMPAPFYFVVFSGFWHEQSRTDRDDYVIILWDNIEPQSKFNFMKYTLSKITHLNALYDYCSIMHYTKYAFSKVSFKNFECSGTQNIKSLHK